MGGVFVRGDSTAVVSVTVIVAMTAFRLRRLYRPALEERPALGQRLLLWVALALLIFGPFIANGDRFDLSILSALYIPAFAMLLFERACLQQGRWAAGPALMGHVALLVAAVLLIPPFLFERNGYLMQKAQRGLYELPVLGVLWVSTLRYLLLMEAVAWAARTGPFQRAGAWLEIGRRAELFALGPLLWTGALFAFGQVGLLIHGDPWAWWQGAASYAWSQGRGSEGAWSLFSGAVEPLVWLPWSLWALFLSGLIAAQNLGKARRLAGLAAAALGLALLLNGAVSAGVWAGVEAMRRGPDTATPLEPAISSPR